MRRLPDRIIEQVTVQRTNSSRVSRGASALESEGFSGSSGGFVGTSGNHSLKYFAPGRIRVLRLGFLVAEGSESGGFTSSEIIAAPYTSTKAANFEHTLPVWSPRPL
jgi:hypothetical protein